ncbi:MAG: hypothetical protein SFT68_02860, partial [Rickettsiaceae bacterium]|nr:hypothetical protein [Rickettsiaceae bacterium]
MLDRFKGIIILVVFLGCIIYLGYRENLKSSWAVQKAVAEALAKVPKFNYSEMIQNSEFKKTVEGLIVECLKENKDLQTFISNSIDEALQKISQESTANSIINANKDKIFSNSSPFVGKQDGKNVLVLFTDYNCAYC